MGRRKKAGDTSLGLLIVVFFGLVAAFLGLALVAPVFLFFWWTYCEGKKLFKLNTHPGANGEERARLGTLKNLLHECYESKSQIEKIGIESGIPRRGDNLFDGRYAAARDINNQLTTVESEIAIANFETHSIQSSIFVRTHDWMVLTASATGARVGIITYIATLLILVNSAPDWVIAFGGLTDIVSFKLSSMEAIWFGSSASSSILAGIALLVTSKISRSYYTKKFAL